MNKQKKIRMAEEIAYAEYSERLKRKAAAMSDEELRRRLDRTCKRIQELGINGARERRRNIYSYEIVKRLIK